MPPPTRRTLLRCGLPMIGGAIAGCPSVGPFGDNAPSELEPGVSIVTQPSVESPPVVDLSLTNTGSETVSVYPREPGSFVFHLVPPFREGDCDIFLLPQDAPAVQLHQGEIGKTGRCYRVTDTSEDDERGPYLAGQALPKETEIEPGRRYTVRHDAYFYGPESECFQAGAYQTTLEIELGDEANTAIDLIYTLVISPENEFTISVETGRDSYEPRTDTATSV